MEPFREKSSERNKNHGVFIKMRIVQCAHSHFSSLTSSSFMSKQEPYTSCSLNFFRSYDDCC